MKRNIYQNLIEWKSKPKRKPLLILGQRQVGKTYIINEFGQNEFKNFININLMFNKQMVKLFEESNNAHELLRDILNLHNLCLDDLKHTLIFIDEIQESNEALLYLKAIEELNIDSYIVCSGSYLGYKISASTHSFPVGKVEFLYMKQMMFDEFLIALKKENMLFEALESVKQAKRIKQIYHEELLQYFHQYLMIGGFPEVIQTYIDNNQSIANALKVVDNIYNSYLQDIDKYAELFKDKTFLRLIFKNINRFIINENKKFKFNEIDKYAKFRELEKFIYWLDESNLVYKVNNLNKLEWPTIDHVIYNSFKLYYSDHSFLNISKNFTNHQNDEFFNKIKGGLCENFVVSQIRYDFNHYNYFSFLNQGRRYEVDLVLENKKNEICAIEIKSCAKFKVTSLKKVRTKNKFVLSTANYSQNEHYINIPIYLAFALRDLI